MKTFFTKLISFILISILWSGTILCQGIALSYEKTLNDIGFLYTVKHADTGFTLYYGDESTGSKDYVRLRNNNTLIWQKEINNAPEYHEPYRFFENESGFYYVGEGGLSTTAAFGRINKISGNIEVQKTFINNQFTRALAINSTYDNNLILGGYFWQNSSIATIKIVNPLGAILQSKASNESGGIWGSNIYQIEKTQDNGYLLVGYINENTNCGELNNRSLWLCKLNSNLNVVWSKKYGNNNGTIDRTWGSDYEGPKAIVTEDNEIILLGHTFCTNGNGGGPNNSGEGTWLMKLNSIGSVLIYKKVGVDLLDYTVTYAGLENSCENSIILSGISGSLLGVSYFVERFDYDLEFKEIIYNSNPQTDKTFLYVDVERGKDNTYLISGRNNLYDTNGNSKIEYFIAKTTPDPSCGINPNPLLCENNTGQFSICEDFDKLQNGNIVPQGIPKFTLFSGSPLENATVTSEKAFSGNKSLKFTNTSDIDFNIDRTIESPSRMEWMTYLDAGMTGSWGLETSNPTVYALVTRLNNRNGTVYTINSSNQLETRGTFTYTPGQWLKTALVFDNIANTIEVWVNNKMIYSRTGHTSRTITDLNLYATEGSPNNLFYIDDLLYYETKIPCTCTSEYAPVCINGKDFSNSCRAACAGYTSNEWTQGPCGGSTASITLDIDDNICGGQNVEIEVPVRVKSYNKIAGLQLRVASSNDNIAEITGVTNIHPNSGLTAIDFAVVNKKLVLTYADSERTLADNSILFAVKVRLKGVINSQANLIFEGDLKALDGNGLTVNVTGDQGSVCVSRPSLSVTGRITNTKDKGIANANVVVTTGNNQVSTAKTENTGQYTISNLMSGTNYKVKPNYTEPVSNGVDISDLFILRRHMQGLTLFSSPYTYVAADINIDKLIDISDLFLMRRILQGLTTELPNNQSAWRFVPNTYNFPTTGNPLTGTIPDALDYNPLTTNQTSQHFIGVKYGDLDHSVIPLNDSGIEKRNNTDVELNISSVTATSGSTVTLEVKCKNFIKGEVMQFSIQWPTDKLQLVNVPSGADIVIPGTTNFDQTQLAQGKLGFIWETDNNSGQGTTLSDNSIVYRLKFKLIGPNNTTAKVENSTTPKLAKFLDANFTEIPLIIGSGIITISMTSASEDEKIGKLVRLYPNPTTGLVFIESDFKDANNIEIRSMDGKLIQVIYKLSDKTIDLTHLAPGSYILKGVTNNFPFARKVVVVR